MDISSTPNGAHAPTNPSQARTPISATLCVLPRFGFFRRIDNVDHAIEVEVRAILKGMNLRSEDLRTSVQPHWNNSSHTEVTLRGSVVCTEEQRDAIDNEILNALARIQLEHKPAHSPAVQRRGD